MLTATRQQSTISNPFNMSTSNSCYSTRSASTGAYIHKSVDKHVEKLNPKRITGRLKNHKDSYKLLCSVFKRTSPHIWWKMLTPYNESTDTATFASGQRWKCCLPLMMDLEYLKKLVKS